MFLNTEKTLKMQKIPKYLSTCDYPHIDVHDT